MAKHFRLQAFLLTALLASAFPSQALLGEPAPLLTPYSATYHLVKGGLAAEVERRLERSSESRWQLHDSARVLFFSLEETAVVDFDGENIKPIKYRYRQNPGTSKDQTIRYNWKKKQATFDLDDGQRQMQTVKLRQTRDGKDRETFIWVAPDLDYLIIKMEQDDDDERIEMQLKPESLKIGS